MGEILGIKMTNFIKEIFKSGVRGTYVAPDEPLPPPPLPKNNMEIYPETKDPLYFVEFYETKNADVLKYKIYQRGASLDFGPPFEGEYQKLMISAFGHPLVLIEECCREKFGTPDKDFIKWIVDAMNEKAQKDLECGGT